MAPASEPIWNTNFYDLLVYTWTYAEPGTYGPTQAGKAFLASQYGKKDHMQGTYEGKLEYVRAGDTVEIVETVRVFNFLGHTITGWNEKEYSTANKSVRIIKRNSSAQDDPTGQWRKNVSNETYYLKITPALWIQIPEDENRIPWQVSNDSMDIRTTILVDKPM